MRGIMFCSCTVLSCGVLWFPLPLGIVPLPFKVSPPHEVRWGIVFWVVLDCIKSGLVKLILAGKET